MIPKNFNFQKHFTAKITLISMLKKTFWMLKCKVDMTYFTFVKFVSYGLSTFVSKNLRGLFDKYAVAGIEHEALVKSTTNIFFPVLWPSQKTQTLLMRPRRDERKQFQRK